METVRAFASCMLELNATRRLLEWSVAQRKIETPTPWLWVPPANLQLTLRVFGELDQGLVGALRDGFATIAKMNSAFRVGISTPVVLQTAGASIVYAGIQEGQEAVQSLCTELDRIGSELGLTPSTLLPPCVVLARGPEGAALPEETLRLPGDVTSWVSELSLLRTDGARPGLEYPSLWRAAFSQPDATQRAGRDRK